jgi:FkbM family methyltransferase
MNSLALLQRMVKRVLRRNGIDLVWYSPATHPLARRARLISTYKINLVLDVGANIGQYGRKLRELGYQGQLISFEPLTAAYSVLRNTAQSDTSWKTMNVALGNTEGSSVINISGNSQSSSLCEILKEHEDTEPESKVIGKEVVTVKTLDSLFDQLCSNDDQILLKIDTQGYEKHVLEGADRALRSIKTLQIEMSLVPLYRDEMLFPQMVDWLARKGFQLVALEPGFSNACTGQLLQIDGMFHRPS